MRIVELAERHGLRVIDIAASKKWNGALYRDDGVHPTTEGNSALASILSEEFTKDKVASCPSGC
jgi:lysophospholipase L1-like esterase